MSADKKHDLRYFDVIVIHLHRTDNVVEFEEEPIELVAVQAYCPASSRFTDAMVSRLVIWSPCSV